MKTIKFKNWNCILRFAYYGNGRTAIRLLEATTKEPIAVATTNLFDYNDLQENEIIIKDWSENEGVQETLEKAGIISAVKRYVPTGYVKANVVDLLIKI